MYCSQMACILLRNTEVGSSSVLWLESVHPHSLTEATEQGVPLILFEFNSLQIEFTVKIMSPGILLPRLVGAWI